MPVLSLAPAFEAMAVPVALPVSADVTRARVSLRSSPWSGCLRGSVAGVGAARRCAAAFAHARPRRRCVGVTASPIRGRVRAMAETVFSKIIRGELPCHKVYEDDQVLAFLDINPLCEGHLLVIPKEPAATLDQLSDDASAAIGRVLPRLSRAVLAATGATEFNVLQNNGAGAHQAVFHVHFHIIPKYRDGKGLGIGWKQISLDASRGKSLAQAIATKIQP
jgi:histidine triad (HIT) family protein